MAQDKPVAIVVHLQQEVPAETMLLEQLTQLPDVNIGSAQAALGPVIIHIPAVEVWDVVHM